ncbi:MAG: hypothetical protein ACRD2L_04340 [Terriglobia bacterium]
MLYRIGGMMAKEQPDLSGAVAVLKDMLILQALSLGLTQGDAAAIAGVDTHRVNHIGKLLKKARKSSQ